MKKVKSMVDVVMFSAECVNFLCPVSCIGNGNDIFLFYCCVFVL